MKTRMGFVSNSSSSSFMCDVCGCIESGMDASPADLGMVECSEGHVLCTSHVKHKVSNDYIECSDCEVCSMEKISDDIILKFLYKKLGVTHEEVLQEMRDVFKTYDALKEFSNK
jgi:hypothetical protein